MATTEIDSSAPPPTSEQPPPPEAQQPQQPVDPSAAQGAQIPLASFTIPSFPPEARSLRALTLTSDINVSTYQDELKKPFSIPTSLPQSIESLTLELFSLGYPAGFLTELSERLPNLKSVVIYSQLFAGISEEQTKDAVTFFKNLPGLRALHLLDVFARPGFFSSAAPWLRYNSSDVPGEARRGLMFLEVNYTFRHEDEEFMSKIQASELPLLIGPGLISSSFNLAEPENAEDDEEDPSTIQGAATKEGIMAFNKTLAEPLVTALTSDSTCPKGLRALNSTLFTFTTGQLSKVLAKVKGCMIVSATVEVEPGEKCKKDLLEALKPLENLEQVEIIANPSLQFFMEVQNPRSGVLQKTFPTAEDMEELAKTSEKLSSFKANVLRTTSLGTVEWKKVDGKWEGGVKPGKGTFSESA